MNDIAQRIKNLPPSKVDSLLKQLRPGMKLKSTDTVAAPARAANRLFRAAQDDNFYLDIDQPGTLGSLSFKARRRYTLNPDHVEVEMEAACMNFRDVAVSLGIYPKPLNGGMIPEMGCDGAGRIVAVGSAVTKFKVGDEVCFLGSDGTFAKYARAREMCTFLKPPSWSFEEFAGLPLIFITVGYALRIPGRLLPSEKILIHSAAGGIGLAAVQVARAIGAEIIATAGTEEKRAFLRSLGIEHVFDSRTMAWVEDVKRVTDGVGVDVVLNSLAGEAIEGGLKVLRSDGRFLELGKRDFVPGRTLDLAPFMQTLVFAAVDTAYVFNLFPERLFPVLDEMRGWIEDGTIKPLPTKTYAVSEIVDAFRFMTSGQHIGRIAIKMTGEPVLVAAK